jgi:hypothetical protein
MIEILQSSKLCPIIHAPSWIAEKGVQDRFYTVFSAGRFGVCDNPGVYEFFNENEVVCEPDATKYVEKSLYYIENYKEQQPFIESVQYKLKSKYNLFIQWQDILSKVIIDNEERKEDDLYDFMSRVSKLEDTIEGYIC